MADVVEKKAQDASEEKQVPATTESTEHDEAQAAKSGNVDVNEKLQKALHDRKRANAEALEAKKKLDETAAKLKAFEDREKTELQKLQEDADKAKAESARLQAELAKKDRVNLALAAGATGDSCDFIAFNMEQEAKKNPDFDATEYIKELKTSKPFLFGVVTKQAVNTGAGTQAGAAKKIEEVTQLQKQMEQCSDPNEKLFLSRALRKRAQES